MSTRDGKPRTVRSLDELREAVDECSRPEPPPRAWEVDVRETEDWFHRLPPDARDRLKQKWRDRDRVGPEWRARMRRRAQRLVWQSALLLPAVSLPVGVLTREFARLPAFLGVAALVGAVLGVGMHVLAAGRFRATALGAVGFLVVEVFGGVASDVLSLVAFFCGLLLAATSYGVFGMRQEFRRLEGVDG